MGIDRFWIPKIYYITLQALSSNNYSVNYFLIDFYEIQIVEETIKDEGEYCWCYLRTVQSFCRRGMNPFSSGILHHSYFLYRSLISEMSLSAAFPLKCKKVALCISNLFFG
jgi:hypothetical protein